MEEYYLITYRNYKLKGKKLFNLAINCTPLEFLNEVKTAVITFAMKISEEEYKKYYRDKG